MKAFKASLFGFGALMALTMMSCDPKTAPVELTASGLNPAKFDTVVNGDTVRLYTLKGDKGMEVCITNYGARIVSMMVPDKNDSLVDVVLGFDNIAQYMEKTTDYGSSVGRYANRINMGRFVLNGDTIQLKQNDKHDGRDHCLHGGGDTGWMNQIYKAEQIDDQTLKLTIVAEDGENGFPGTVTATTTYKIVNGNTLDITWEATTDKPTIINQTNHNYYNLSGDFEEPAGGLNQWLSVNADSFTVADDSYMPTGEIRAVEGTTMDLRRPQLVPEHQGRRHTGCCYALQPQDRHLHGDVHQRAWRTGLHWQLPGHPGREECGSQAWQALSSVHRCMSGEPEVSRQSQPS